MKTKITIITMALAFGLFACTGTSSKEASEESNEAVEVVNSETISYKINIEQSVVKWKGSMVGVYAHEGTINIAEGFLTTNSDRISGGNFDIDLNTIVTTDDDALYEMAPREKLIEHLKSDDFFGAKSYPKANFIVKSVDGNVLTGDLTIKGVTNQETVTDVEMSQTEGTLSAIGTLVFDRQKYGVAYKNTMNDMVLSDNIEINISIVGEK